MSDRGTAARQAALRQVVRRTLVVVGVVLSLVGGMGAIQAAASWTATFAKLVDPPPSIAQLEARLADEQARSEALQAQLDQLVGGSADLASALDAAGARVQTDNSTATDLRASLAAAQARLAALQQTLTAAGIPLPSRAPSTPPPLPTTDPGASVPPGIGSGAGAAGPTATPRPPGVPASWPSNKPIPPMPSGCVQPQLEDNGVWNCQH